MLSILYLTQSTRQTFPIELKESLSTLLTLIILHSFCLQRSPRLCWILQVLKTLYHHQLCTLSICYQGTTQVVFNLKHTCKIGILRLTKNLCGRICYHFQGPSTLRNLKLKNLGTIISVTFRTHKVFHLYLWLELLSYHLLALELSDCF